MNNQIFFEAAFVGRFQPFHNGHLKAVQSILKECSNLLIIIGSVQENGTLKNPFDFELRRKMIVDSLIEAEIDLARVEIVALPDIGDDSRWVDYLIDSVPRFKFMYTGSLDTRKLFQENSRIPVRSVDFLNGLSGTLVRRKFRMGKSVVELVPKPVSNLM